MNNPIIYRELVGLLRTRRAFALQLGLVVVLAALVLLRWPSDAYVDLSGRQALQVLQLFGYGLMVTLMLLAPVFPATAIVREKQQGTLALLLNSPMRPWEILMGKLLGVLGFILLLVVLSLPAAAACYAMGGVALEQFFGVYVILVLLAIQYASLGLLVSSYASSTDAALRFTYGWILILAVVTLGPHQFLQGLVDGPAAMAVDWIRCLSPIPAMMQVLGHGGVGAQGLQATTSLWVQFMVMSGASILLFNAMTTRRLSQRLLDRPRPQGQITDEQSRSRQLFRRLMYMWFFDPQRRSRAIGPLSNPVMVKEFRCRKLGRAHWIARLFCLSLLVSLGLILATTRSTMDWGVETLASIIVILQVAVVVLITPSLASGLISGERESGGWQLLQMTPLSTLTIVAGKLMSVCYNMLLLLLATMPAYLVLIYVDVNQATVITQIVISLVLTALFAVLISAAASSVFARTAPATGTSYAILIALCAGTMFVWLLRDAPFSFRMVETVLKINPLAGALRLIESPGFVNYNLIPANWIFMAVGCAAGLTLLSWRIWSLTRPR